MPKGFSEREKAIIRANLLEKAKELFGTYGIRKTNVEELTKAAGISKGAFYLFYDSKEELYFELLEQYEAGFRATMLQKIASDELPPRKRMKALLRKALSVWKSNALFAHFAKEEYEYLFRKLPAEKIEMHLHQDDSFAVDFIAAWKKAGVAITCDPKQVAGLIRALFFIRLHEEDFGAGVYTSVIEVYIDLLSSYLVPE
jgi:AcrR family transcriptional regulator